MLVNESVQIQNTLFAYNLNHTFYYYFFFLTLVDTYANSVTEILDKFNSDCHLLLSDIVVTNSTLKLFSTKNGRLKSNNGLFTCLKR